jgi:CBS domain-containing protein
MYKCRVLALSLDPLTCVSHVMTKSPKCVQEDDSALDALEMMVDNRYQLFFDVYEYLYVYILQSI